MSTANDANTKLQASNDATTEQLVEAARSSDDVHVKIGGLWFILDPKTVSKLNSPFLDSHIRQASATTTGDQTAAGPPTTIVIDEADHECFTSLVQMARYNTLPILVLTSREKLDKLLGQAAFWEIPNDAVLSLLNNARDDILVSLMSYVDDHILTPSSTKDSAEKLHDTSKRGQHHNDRLGHGGEVSFGTRCTLCDFGERKLVFLEGESYSQCINCRKEIVYKKKLQWCHKCRCCVDCQEDDNCPGFEYSDGSPSTLSMLFNLDDKVQALRDKL